MRIDNYLANEKKYTSRTKAKEAVERGEVLVNGKIVKPSYEICEKDVISFSDDALGFVSNGAFKLERAFEIFELNVEGKTVADIGASTGGFTQSLLNHGAARVFAVDVGESLLHPIIRDNPAVVVFDNTNARFIDENTFGCKMDVVVSDVSFISLTYILPSIYKILSADGDAVVLVKPQFECGPKALSKNGIVTDKKNRYLACKNIVKFAEGVGFGAIGFTNAPIRQGKNVEFLLHLRKYCSSLVDEKALLSVCVG